MLYLHNFKSPVNNTYSELTDIVLENSKYSNKLLFC